MDVQIYKTKIDGIVEEWRSLAHPDAMIIVADNSSIVGSCNDVFVTNRGIIVLSENNLSFIVWRRVKDLSFSRQVNHVLVNCLGGGFPANLNFNLSILMPFVQKLNELLNSMENLLDQRVLVLNFKVSKVMPSSHFVYDYIPQDLDFFHFNKLSFRGLDYFRCSRWI